MKKTICVLAMALMAGCSSLPQKKAFFQISDMPYKDGTLDCRHKARLYNLAIQDEVYDSSVVTGRKNGDGHVWVEYREESNSPVRLADPTANNVPGLLRKYYIEYESLSHLPWDFRDVDFMTIMDAIEGTTGRTRQGDN